MTACVAFAAQSDKFTQVLEAMEEHHKPNLLGVPKGGAGSSSATNSFEATNRILNKIQENFEHHMKLFNAGRVLPSI